MCTLPVAFAASAIFSAYGSYRQGQAAAQASEYQARVADVNAQAAQNQMKSVADKEAIDKETLKRSVAKQRATGRTGYAAGGVVLGTGSALDWELDMTAQEETDLAIISYNADLERSSLQNQIGNYQNQAQGSRMAAKDSRNAAVLGAGTSLLGSYVTYKTTF